MSELAVYLRSLRACDEAREWAADYDDLPTTWAACERSDWMLWLIDKAGLADDATNRRIACRCARGTPLMGGGTTWDLLTDERSRTAIEVSERYTDGLATDEELAAAENAALDAARAAALAAENAALDAARAAALAAENAALAAARVAASDAAWAAAHRWQCDVIREMIPAERIAEHWRHITEEVDHE